MFNRPILWETLNEHLLNKCRGEKNLKAKNVRCLLTALFNVAEQPQICKLADNRLICLCFLIALSANYVKMHPKMAQLLPHFNKEKCLKHKRVNVEM